MLEMQPRQYSMVWIAWYTTVSPKSNCKEKRGYEGAHERRRLQGLADGGRTSTRAGASTKDMVFGVKHRCGLLLVCHVGFRNEIFSCFAGFADRQLAAAARLLVIAPSSLCKSRDFKFSHGLCQEKTAQQQRGIHTSSPVNCLYLYGKRDRIPSRYCGCTFATGSARAFCKMWTCLLPKAKTRPKATLKKPHLCTVPGEVSVSWSFCLNNKELIRKWDGCLFCSLGKHSLHFGFNPCSRDCSYLSEHDVLNKSSE